MPNQINIASAFPTISSCLNTSQRWLILRELLSFLSVRIFLKGRNKYFGYLKCIQYYIFSGIECFAHKEAISVLWAWWPSIAASQTGFKWTLLLENIHFVIRDDLTDRHSLWFCSSIIKTWQRDEKNQKKLTCRQHDFSQQTHVHGCSLLYQHRNKV